MIGILFESLILHVQTFNSHSGITKLRTIHHVKGMFMMWINLCIKSLHNVYRENFLMFYTTKNESCLAYYEGK